VKSTGKKIDGRTVAGRKLAAAARAANGARKPGRPPRAKVEAPVASKPARKTRKPRVTPEAAATHATDVMDAPVKKTRGRKKAVVEAPPAHEFSEGESQETEHQDS
jgi:hypothetical protein